MGGTYTPENVSLLSIPEHAEAHHQLYLLHGHQADFIAWRALSGQIDAKAISVEVEQMRRQKLSAAFKGIPNHHPGYPHSLKTRQKMSLIKKSVETRRKMSVSAKQRPNNFLGKHHSDATRTQMSESAKRRCQEQPRTGWIHSEESKMKMSETKRLHREQRMVGV